MRVGGGSVEPRRFEFTAFRFEIALDGSIRPSSRTLSDSLELRLTLSHAIEAFSVELPEAGNWRTECASDARIL